ncbi:putative F420-dependent oxidoreductase [Mycolicibacterium rhodesiae JS60]|nr:putative F420-dependent oxidoreductase [Mycolicibacterium rhodesiae JS60]
MRFGLTLGVDIPPSPPALVSLVTEAERLGFSTFWLGDHVVIPRVVDDAAHQRDVGGAVRIADKTVVDVFEPVVTLAYLAGQVHTIRLGFNVLVIPYRNPVLTAKMLASIDVLSRGRLMLGAGVGWMEGEFIALGTSFVHRGAVTDEYLEVMVRCWTEEQPSFHGRYYDLADIAFRPKPQQKPHIPIYIGGSGDAALRRAARLGQGWLPLFHSPDELEPKLVRLNELCMQAGRDPCELAVIPSVRVRLRPEDDPNGIWSGSNPAAIRSLVDAYARLGVQELTLVIVEPDLDVETLHDRLRWWAAEVM